MLAWQRMEAGMGADYVTLRDRIDELVAQHGTLRATARVLMTDAADLLDPAGVTTGEVGQQ